MHNEAYAVETVELIEVFDALRTRWDELHARDRNAHVFSSWAWQRAYWETSPYAPFVAAVRDVTSGAYVAFAPLAREKWPARLPIASALHLGGSPKADYTGFIADPAHEAGAIEALLTYIGALEWDHAFFEDVRDPRYERIVEKLRSRGRVLVASRAIPCLSIRLGDDFETYLKTVSKRFRAGIRRSLRTFEHMNAILECATDVTIDARIDTLIRLNHLRWHGNLAHARARFGRLFRNAYDRGCLQIFSLRQGEATVASQAVFFCEREQSYLVYMTATNPRYAKYSPGIALNALVIQHAIQHRYKRYDFTRGNETYKRSFGTQSRYTSSYVLSRAGLRAPIVWVARGCLQALKVAGARVLVAAKLRSTPLSEVLTK